MPVRVSANRSPVPCACWVRVTKIPESGWRIRVRVKVSAVTSEWRSNPMIFWYHATLFSRSLTLKLTWLYPVIEGMSFLSGGELEPADVGCGP